MIIVGDLHFKKKEPFRKSIIQFLKWLQDNYKDETIIFLGDVFDNSSPEADIEHELLSHLVAFKKVYLITGNHDQSYLKGNCLLPSSLHSNIKVIEPEDQIVIENQLCLFLPHISNNKVYENLEGKYDFIFTHIVPIQCQFANEGIVFPKLKGTFIHGHTHIQEEFNDDYGNKHIVLGVPLPTRNGENQEHKILHIDEKGYNHIPCPIYFQYEDVEYGRRVSSKNNIINIKDAPSKKLAYEKYKDYYIRDEGITVLRTNTTKEDFKKEFGKESLLGKFMTYAKEKDLSKEVLDFCSQQLSGLA